MPGGECSYQEAWNADSKFKDWISKESDKYAKCRICQKSISIENMGESALTSHMRGTKHREKFESRSKSARTSILSFFGTKSTSTCSSSSSRETTETSTTEPTVSSPTTSETHSNAQFVEREACASTDVTKAEVLWALHNVNNNNSLRSNTHIDKLFQAMFPDSKIAQQFACGRDKMEYIVNFGIAPFLRDRLETEIKQASHYVLLFDESFNKHLKMIQMDVHIRFWSNNGVESVYFDSFFLVTRGRTISSRNYSH